MNGKQFLLDTNIVIALFKSEQKVVKKIEDSEKIFLPIIVIGELFFGAELSDKKKENIEKVENLSRETTTLFIKHQTATYYAKIKAQLKTQGTPIPENDIWIAAIALENDLTVVTRDKHFDLIKNIKVVKW